MLRAAAAALVAAALAAPAAATAAIVPQQSIAGVHLRMSEAGVRHALGTPRSARTVPDEIQGSVRHLDYGLTDVWLSTTADGTVYHVITTSRRQRTRGGVGVGSSERAVRRGVAGVRCEGAGTTRTCAVGQLLPGRRVTTFFLSAAGRVKRVSLGFVID